MTLNRLNEHTMSISLPMPKTKECMILDTREATKCDMFDLQGFPNGVPHPAAAYPTGVPPSTPVDRAVARRTPGD